MLIIKLAWKFSQGVVESLFYKDKIPIYKKEKVLSNIVVVVSYDVAKRFGKDAPSKGFVRCESLEAWLKSIPCIDRI